MSDDFDETATLRAWFERFTKSTGERVEQITFGTHPGDEWDEPWPLPSTNDPVAVTDDALWLDIKFDDGYGGTESPNLCAWSKSYVLFSDTYDGSEGLCWVPRAPTAHEPIRPGGG